MSYVLIKIDENRVIDAIFIKMPYHGAQLRNNY